MYNVYQVKIGDTLDGIANLFGITKEELLSINNIKENIGYGDFIVVPTTVSNFMNYTIKKGDTIYGIAAKYNIPVDNILSIIWFIDDKW